jgi:hypothetical protein
MEIIILVISGILLITIISIIITDKKIKYKKSKDRKSFYIMKVIYNDIIYRALAINVRNVQQSLYMGECKYKLKILKNGD